MKKLFLMSAVIASAFALGSCSNDEPINNGGENGISTGEPKYLAITITADNSRSRAEDDKNYEHGEEFESDVNSLDLYFFDANGNPAMVKADGTNHMTVQNPTSDKPENDENVNISKVTDAVIVIQTPKDRAIPTQIVAVVNKEASQTYAGLTIEKLQESLTEGKVGNSFVMSNSVYVSGGSLQIGAEVAGHLFNSETEAKASPVTIYVERTLAKVRLNATIKGVTLTNGAKAYNPNNPNAVDSEGNKSEKVEQFGNKQIYVQFLGWNTTATSTKNRLVKVINPLWNAGWSWYDAYRHRSFWAVNAPDNGYDYFKFNVDNQAANAITNFEGGYTYLKENAAVAIDETKPNNPSQVIIAAQLVDENGDAIEMAEWAGLRMTVDDLKKAFANAATLYYKTEGTDEAGQPITVFNKIDPSEIEIKTATEAGYLGVNENKRYLVYGTLTDAAAKKVWYNQALNDEANKALTTEQIKEIFFSVGGAKVWKNGLTYYYFDIRHLEYGNASAEFGQLGVVRNHVYDAAVSSLVGLGTPVYRPEEVIIPEKPSDDNTFIAAEIKVLSWRIVPQDIPLEW